MTTETQVIKLQVVHIITLVAAEIYCVIFSVRPDLMFREQKMLQA